MREILFRGKNKQNKWVEGIYYHQTEFYGDDCDYHYIITTKDELEDNMISYCRVIPETIGQYTGLTNENGTKIFEGDLLKGVSGLVWLVAFENGSFVCKDEESITYFNFYEHEHFNDYEVIGNAADNPELLKRGVKE